MKRIIKTVTYVVEALVLLLTATGVYSIWEILK